MYVTLLQFDFQVSILLFLVWIVAAVGIGRLATRPTHGKMRAAARRHLVVLALAELLIVAKLVLFGAFAGYGWQFAADRKLITLLLAAVPGGLALVYAAPRLWRLARAEVPEPDAPALSGDMAVARSQWLTLPVQATAAGGLGGMFEVFLPPHRSVLGNLLVYGGGLGLAAALLWWRRRARVRRMIAAAAGHPQRRMLRAAIAAATALVVGAAGVGLFVTSMRASALPDTYDMMRGVKDYGGGPTFPHSGSLGEGVSVTDLVGPRDREPDRSITLTAQAKTVRLSSGVTFEAWTYNGQVPGPELRVREGELVEVTLVNQLPKAPVTIHWHGVDVPNAEDGVAGVTQDAVQPGESHTYRFVADEVGTRWYHSHQQASEQVRRGLFGSLVIEPRTQERPVDEDISALFHTWETPKGKISAFGASDALRRRTVAAGQRVRVRLTNTSNQRQVFALSGVPYRITAMDGADVTAPAKLTGRRLPLGAAGRYDLEFTMPETPVRLVEVSDPSGGLLLSPDGRGSLSPDLDGPELDPTAYGKPSPPPIDADTTFDREFELVFDDWLGFYNGRFTLRQSVNGAVFPYAPMHLVREGDLVKMRFVNRGEEDHPMHLHGHHMVVLSRNGEPVSGSPMVMDTVNVRGGEVWEVAFEANNPGVWMDHCHNFDHTSLGLVLHLAYEGVNTPFVIGGKAHNHPE